MIRTEIKKLIQEAIKSHWDVDLELAEIKIDYPPEGFGDYSTNAAMNLAKIAKSNPMEIAEDVAEHLKKNDLFEKIEIAKPGFINFYLAPEVLWKSVSEINKTGEDFGNLDIGKGKKVQVEFISANPTGPLTLGNGRGGFYGDALANVLVKVRFGVEREYYINDIGHQVEILVHSLLGDEKAQYKGEYIEQLRKEKELKEILKTAKTHLNLEFKKLGEMAVMIIWNSMIRPTIEDRMKIKFNYWAPESEFHKHGIVQKTLELLIEKDLTYEKEGAIWFKSSKFGDDKDRVLVTSNQTKKNGESTYFLADIAYHYDKFVERKFDKVINIWGADHHGYVSRLQAIGKALGEWDENKLKIIIMQLVRLVSGGKEVKMSKRAGNYITIDELLDEIPLDVARFFFLMYSPDTHMNFDLDLAKEHSQKNPVYYAQYAYARICSILAKTKKESEKADKNLKLLNHKSELKLTKQLIKFPEIIEDIAYDYQVHRLPHYALDLVRIFHKFYEECRVIDEENPDLTQARLSLIEATQIVLKSTLDLMGISAPEKM